MVIGLAIVLYGVLEGLHGLVDRNAVLVHVRLDARFNLFCGAM
jgi:hypothetical protein